MPHSAPRTKVIQIQVADPEQDPAEEVFPISNLDGIMPKIYNPITCTYPLAAGADTAAVVANTSAGLQKLMREYRFLAGSLHEDAKSGDSYIQRGAGATTFPVHVNDLRRTDYPSYGELAARHFPVRELDARLLPPGFTPAPVVDAAGASCAAALVQLNLIRGGVVLGLAVHHLCCDARGLDALLARWAAHTRALFHRSLPPPAPIALADASPLNSRTPAADYTTPAVGSLRYRPGAPPTSSIPPEAMASCIWHVPASKLAALKALAAAGEEDERDGAWASTNDCLTALMWRSIARSRLALHALCGATDPRPVALENSLDIRARVGASSGEGEEEGEAEASMAPAAYPGNVVMFSRAALPLNALLSGAGPAAFRRVALAVRAAIDEYRAPATIRAAVDWIAACPRKADVEMAFDVVLGLDTVVTSWRVLTAYETADFGFPGPESEGGRSALGALRWATPVFDGYCFFYPKRLSSGDEDEGVEVYLGMEKGCMERMLADEELAQWAEVRGG